MSFAVVFTDITRREVLPEEASIDMAIKSALKEINKRNGKRWVIITHTKCSMLYNKENHPILNQIYDITEELQNKNKQIILCKVPAHIGIELNKRADKAGKQIIDMPGIITTRLLYTDYYLTIMRAETQDGKGSEKTVLANYTTSNPALKSKEMPSLLLEQYKVMLNRLSI